jgi:hypothetical protein
MLPHTRDGVVEDEEGEGRTREEIRGFRGQNETFERAVDVRRMSGW